MSLSPALLFAVPLFFLGLAAARRSAPPVLCLISLLALAAAILGLVGLPKAQAVVDTLFVFALELSSLYIIYSLSSYRLYVSALFLLLSCATLFALLSTFLPVPSLISPALLILFSLLSFPVLSYIIFPPARGSRTHSRLTASPSLIPFTSLAPSTSSAASGVFAPAATAEKSAHYEVGLEGPPPSNHSHTSVAGVLLIAQFLFLISSIFHICSASSALKTVQTAFLVVSSLFTTFAYSQYVRSFLCVRDRVPEQAPVCHPTTPYAQGIYSDINSTNDATVPTSQHSLSPSASMSFSLRGRTNSVFTLASHHTGASQTLHVNGQAASKAPTDPIPLWIRTDDATLHNRPGTNRDGATVAANNAAANDANSIYMPTPVRVLPPSHLFPDDNPMGPATTLDPRQNAPHQPTSDVASDIAVATCSSASEKAPMLVHKRSAWSISSSSAVSVPIVTSPTPTLYSSSSSLTLSGMCMKPRSQTLSTTTRQMPILAKCVPLDVLSRKMESAENPSAALQPGVASGGKDRRDRQQAWLRADNGMGSRSRSISAASSLTVYDGPEWVSGEKEKKKRGGFIFGRHGQGNEERQDKIQDEPVQGSRSNSFFNRQGMPSIRRAIRGRSLSISLLSNLIGRRKSIELEHDEDANEPISPSSSVSVSSTSLLSSLSMSLSRGPASPTSPASPASPSSLRTPGNSEPASPTESRNDEGGSGKKNSLYYWKSRKVKKDVNSGAVLDLQQSPEPEGDRDYDRVVLMVDDQGLPDFMDLTDPFAPPDLGTRVSIATTADDVLLGEGKANLWGRLPLAVMEQRKATGAEARRVVARPKAPGRKGSLGHGEAGRRGKVRRTTSIGRGKGAGAGDPLSRSRSKSKAKPVFGSLKIGLAPSSDAAANRAGSGCANLKSVTRTGSARRTRMRLCREEDHDRGGLDVEEALLAQKLLMKLDLAPPPPGF